LDDRNQATAHHEESSRMHRWKWTEIAAFLLLAGGAAGAVASCTDVGDSGGTPSEDAGGFDATAEDVNPGAEVDALDEVTSDSSPPGTLADAGPTTGGVDAMGGGADTGAGDSGSQDSGAPGTGGHDAGVVDAGGPDTSAAEAGSADTGVADTGSADTGTDASISEAGGADTGAPDAGGADTGAADGSRPDSGTGGDGGGLTTGSFLASLGSDCLSCAQTNGCLDPAQAGGTCEGTPGTATLLSGSLPDGKTCADPTVLGSSSPTQTQVCLATLQVVFTSQCAATFQENPCLCGATDVAMCLGGSATPTGPAYDIFSCGFDSTSAVDIQAKFTNQALGAGQANTLIECMANYGCNSCFGQP
jgi:hypothetical protein